ncbi:MAG TPA: D-alanyl-D-alanine carboxypeptidase/D-alanyl-D-alanine-endopeptidase [Burkholderiaceae bacterium]|jgi:D-alanyl-D-alanine carboxypeptidase/D-alanyl-D-alanine-endopeptidase (penicillin-binding protein 4)|nr:D-alanyl-D-alanine carboxypeptidase/D-alanyl-D-alanine-endopeptidase [Burkholderiaceae bacterium]
MQINRCQSHLFTLLALCTSLQICAANELPATVSVALKHAAIPAKAVGIVVQEVGSREALIAVNQGSAFNPASTMKLVTTDAALELLGPTFTWKTQAYASGNINSEVLTGNLIFKGSGDPKLVTENFWLFLRQIRAAGIREIHGNVLLDRSAFEPQQTDSEKFDGDPVKPYNAVPDALLLNYQSLRFQFMPNNASGAASVVVDPPLANYDIAPPAWTHDDCGDWQGKLGMNISVNGVRFAGRYAASCGDKAWYVRPYQMTPNQYFSVVFKKMWTEVGGKFSGDVIDGVVPADARLITVWESPTLSEVVRDINKFSNNIMARQLLLTLANAPSTSTALQLPANEQRGAQAVRGWLDDKRIEAAELQIENGSGLSRNERIAPATMADLLVKAYRSPLMPEFIASMPLVGYDGTMRRRLSSQDVAGNAHIKTGTLNEVKAVAGYVTALSGKRYVVVFFINHPNAAGGGAAQDALIEWIYSHG